MGMKHLAFAALLLLAAAPAHAQQARVVAACGSLAPFGPIAAGGQAYPTIDVNGQLCLSGGGGGGGSTTITAGTTPTSGFTAGQLMMSDGSLTQAAGGVVAVRNGANPNALRVYNTYTDASNGEWAALDWQTTPNTLIIGTQANGTGAARCMTLRGGTLQMDIACTNGGYIRFGAPLLLNANPLISAGVNAAIGLTAVGVSSNVAVITGSGGTCAASSQTAGSSTVGTTTLTGVCASGNTIALTTLPTYTTGWNCDAEDRTTRSAGPFIESATTTNSVTFTVGANPSVAGDVLQWKCMGY